MITTELPPHLQKLVDLGISGTDILHGELKNLMYNAETNWKAALDGEPLEENEYDPSDDYYEGYLQGLGEVYELTYLLAFAIDERAKSNG